MNILNLRLPFYGAALLALYLGASPILAAPAAAPPVLTMATNVTGFSVAGQRAFDARSLRGYGTVAGTSWQLKNPAGAASVLQISCESVAKAQLVQAKYLSDLSLLPGVREIELPQKIAAREVAGQGAVAALRDGSSVWIVAAKSPADLQQLVQSALQGDKSKLVSAPEIEVPMWLDRWDKFGFRFYYRPWEAPPNLKGAERDKYDITGEFEWAKEQNVGFVFWDGPMPQETAEGINKGAWWDWAQQAAREKKLPVGINDMGGDMGWIPNRFREQTAQKMPQFVGSYYAVADSRAGSQGFLSWNGTEAKNLQLGQLQEIVRRYAPDANVTSWLEPSGELYHGAQDIFMEYGPVADATFREFLQTNYKTVDAVNARWKTQFKSWNEVRVPEIASFAGWGDGAIDLSGTWRAGFLDAPSADAPKPDPKTASQALPAEWSQPKFDDSAWPQIEAPGNDQAMFLPRRPAVYRRNFEVPANWKTANPKTWLYLWDLNLAWGDSVSVTVNGQLIGSSKVQHPQPHWAAFDATAALKAGTNQISLSLPQGYLAYRVYLSPDEPRQYPHLGEAKNALWADFVDWMRWSRIDDVQRGMEMIRQVDPDRQIVLMHPDENGTGVRELARKYGGQFHNTGYMGAFWADHNPMMMASLGLPADVEPGGPAPDLPALKRSMGLWATEGITGIDYFIHIGNVLWNPEIKNWFEQNQNFIHLFGKYHLPTAEVAVLQSDRQQALVNYPWYQDYNTNLSNSYFSMSPAQLLTYEVPRDGITEADFTNGIADKYRVIIDSNTSILDEATIKSIENWVRGGGVFITWVQTGRNTPDKFNSWPIEQLTGYHVTNIDPLADNGDPVTSHKIALTPGQQILKPDNWADIGIGEAGLKAQPNANWKFGGNGLSLQKVAPEAQDIMQWDDGSTALGVRPIGKGFVVNMGVKFFGARYYQGNPDNARKLILSLLDWQKIARIPATANGVMMRHYISNNGLYDVWTLFNQTDKAVTTDLVFRGDTRPAACLNVVDGSVAMTTVQGGAAQLNNLAFEPLETKTFLSQRAQIQNAPADWFALQRGWWQGTTAPPDKKFPAPPMKIARDLSEGWRFKALDVPTDGAALAAPGVDDANWEVRRMGIWNYPDHRDVQHGIFRRQFTVPAEWSGHVGFSLRSFFASTFLDKGRIFLDGKLVFDWKSDGPIDDEFGGALAPGSTHLVAVEIQSQRTLSGARGAAWLSNVPAPQSTQDLSGEWIASTDALHYDTKMPLPGAWNALMARRSVDIKVDAAQKDKTVILHLENDGRVGGAIINGHWVRRNHDVAIPRWDVNITPWVKFGQPNEIQLVALFDPTKANVTDVRLNFYAPGVFP